MRVLLKKNFEQWLWKKKFTVCNFFRVNEINWNKFKFVSSIANNVKLKWFITKQMFEIRLICEIKLIIKLAFEKCFLSLLQSRLIDEIVTQLIELYSRCCSVNETILWSVVGSIDNVYIDSIVLIDRLLCDETLSIFVSSIWSYNII